MSEQRTQAAPRPLLHYMKTGKISWRRISDEDKRTVIDYLRETCPGLVEMLAIHKREFGTSPPYVEISPKFWFWLADRRNKERAAGANA